MLPDILREVVDGLAVLGELYTQVVPLLHLHDKKPKRTLFHLTDAKSRQQWYYNLFVKPSFASRKRIIHMKCLTAVHFPLFVT